MPGGRREPREKRRPKLHRIIYSGPGRLSIMGRPHSRRLSRTLRSLRRRGVTTVVSMFTQRELAHYRLVDLWRDCKEAELDYIWWPVPEHGVPGGVDADEFMPELRRRLIAGEHIVIQCRLALGRSPMVAIALLTGLHVPLADAHRAVSAARGRAVPGRAAQSAWVRRWADAASAGTHS